MKTTTASERELSILERENAKLRATIERVRAVDYPAIKAAIADHCALFSRSKDDLSDGKKAEIARDVYHCALENIPYDAKIMHDRVIDSIVKRAARTPE